MHCYASRWYSCSLFFLHVQQIAEAGFTSWVCSAICCNVRFNRSPTLRRLYELLRSSHDPLRFLLYIHGLIIHVALLLIWSFLKDPSYVGSFNVYELDRSRRAKVRLDSDRRIVFHTMSRLCMGGIILPPFEPLSACRCIKFIVPQLYKIR